MSDNNPSRPLTRREIREREQAAAARLGGDGQSAAPAPHHAPAPAPAPAPSRAQGSYGAPSGYSGGYRPDARPAPAPAPAPQAAPPSRRSMRDQAQPAAPGYPTSAPVVRPPSSSGGMRGLDETGRLTPIQRTSEQTGVRSARPAAASAPSDSGHAAPGWRTQGAGAPAPQASRPAPASVQPSARPSQPSARAGSAAPAPAPSAAAATQAPDAGAPPRRSPFESPRSSSSPFGSTGSAPTGLSAGAGLAGLGAGTAAASSSTASAAPAATSSSAPALPWASPVGDRPTSVAPAAVPPAGSGEQSRAAASPFDALVGAEQPVRARAAAPQEDVEDDEDWDEPEASYTWLHYIVLVVVAFVLGLLLWKLLLEGPDQSFTTDAAPAAPVSLDVRSSGVALPEGAA